MRNSKCWASSLDNCSAEISGEHIISASLFPKKSMLDLSGMSWLKGKQRKVSIERLTSNILCTHHNSTTSELDSEAGAFFQILEKIAKDFKSVGRLYQPKVQRYSYNGYLLERWMLKTLINLWKSESLDNSVPLHADLDELTRLVYGLQKFPGKSGLYVIAKVGMHVDTKSEVGMQTITYDGRIVAAIFELRSILFVLWLIDDEMPSMDQLNLGKKYDGMMPSWHFKEIKITQGLFSPKIINLTWDAS